MSTKFGILILMATILIGTFAFLKYKNMLNVYRFLTTLSIIFTFGSLAVLIGYVISKGVPYIKPSLFSFEYTSDNVSMLPAIITTFITVILSVALATPIGVFTAIYLVEYAKRGSKVVEVIRLAAETLQGIPSIVYGLFGMMFFLNLVGIWIFYNFWSVYCIDYDIAAYNSFY